MTLRFAAAFLLGFLPLTLFDGFWVMGDRNEATWLAVLLLALVGSLLALLCRAVEPVWRLLAPAEARLRTGSRPDLAPLALGLAWGLAPQAALLADEPLRTRLSFHVLWAPGTTLAVAAVLFYLLVRGLRGIRLPGTHVLLGLTLAAYLLTAAGFGWRDAASARVQQAAQRPDRAQIAAAQRPHVLLVVLDTLRAEGIGGAWEGQTPMPWFEEFAARGRTYARGYAAANFTPPGHAALFTGRYPAECDTLGIGEISLPGAQRTLAEHLLAAGYRTAGVTSNVRIGKMSGFHQGFEIYDQSLVAESTVFIAGTRVAQSSLTRGLGGRFARRGLLGAVKRFASNSWASVDAAQTTAIALRTLDALEPTPGEPVFLFVNYYDPHLPYRTREDLAREFFPNSSEPDLDACRTESLTFHGKLFELGADLRSGTPTARTLERVRWVEEAYWEQCRELDLGLRELFSGLEQRGILNSETLILVTSDHGEHLGEHGHFLHGSTLFEPSVRAPFWLSGPGIAPGRDADSLVSGVDFFPTVLTALGVAQAEWPSGLTGSPLQGGVPVDRLIRFESGTLRGFTTQHRKMIARDYGDHLEWTHAFELAADPEERNNLIGSAAPAWVLEFMQRPPFSASAGAGLRTEGAGTLDLAALGYVEEALPLDR
jgi:arylsulfatase A-like enzyme